MTGTGQLKPDTRLVTATAAKTGSTTTAVVDGTTVTIQVARDLTVAAGDVLLVLRYGSQWFAVARGFTAAPTAPENDTAPDPKPAVVTGTLSVSPVETRSYRSGGWRFDNDDVYEGQYGGNGNHTGAVFYGGKPRSLAGATVLGASIRVRRSSGGGAYAAQPTIMRLMTQATRPGGAVTLGASTAGPSLKRGETVSAFTIPDSWAQAMVDGTAGGLAFYDADGSPYVILDGRGSYGPAFTMSIRWQRT
jgi:hypothetical protein